MILIKDDVKLTANDFLSKYKSGLELGDNDQLNVKKVQKDKLGYTHSRIQQYYKGIPVEGAEIVLHEKNGRLEKLNGNMVKKIDVSIASPQLSSKQALQKALDYVNATKYMWEDKTSEDLLKKLSKNTKATYYPNPELVFIDPNYTEDGKNYHLAYKIDVFAMDPIIRKYIYVDAENGEIIHEINRIHETDIAGTANTVYNGVQNINANYNGINYKLNTSTAHAAPIQTYNSNSTNNTNITEYEDLDNYWNDDTSDKRGAQSHWGIESTVDYYYTTFGQISYNGAGANVTSYTDYGNLYNNASWNGSYIVFGSGDGTNYNSWNALDVVAHEFTHGVTEYSANLVYSNESGALNESFSDIFGNVIENYASPSTANWIVGESITKSGSGIRSMSNPNAFSDPDTYGGTYWYTGTSDNGGVHTNSGVQNYWFYLLCEGGNVTNDFGNGYSISAIGIDATAAIAYRTLTVYLTSASNYEDARLASIQAASDLFGANSIEYNQVLLAWAAVGVGPIISQPANDLTVTNVYATSACWIGNENIGITITNYSLDTILSGSAINVSYSLDGDSTIIEQLVLSSDLAPLSSIDFNFSIIEDLSLKNKVSIIAEVNYSADANTSNNIYTGNAFCMRGDFTIGSNADFKTLTSAIAELNRYNTICGPLVFNVKSGMYSESTLSISNLNGTSSTNTLTIQSESGNAQDVTLSASGTSSFSITSSNYINIKGLTISGGTTYIIYGYETNYCNYENNIITGGSYGIYLRSATENMGNSIINNNFNNQSSAGNYLYRQSSVISQNNYIQATSSSYGICGYYISGILEKNEINNSSTSSSKYGIYLFGLNSNPIRISNNFVSLVNGTGIYLQSTDEIYIYNNSINLSGTTTSSTKCIYISTPNKNIFLLNNILNNNSSFGYGIYLNSASYLPKISSSNYNDIYVPSGFVAGVSSINYQTLDSWKSYSGLDINSLNLDPLFISSTDLHSASPYINNAGIPITEIQDDIDGDMRSATNPDIGADELNGNNAAVIAIDTISCAGNQSISITIKNTGFETLTSLNINCSINGIALTQYNWSGSLSPLTTNDVILGNFDFTGYKDYTISVVISLPNGFSNNNTSDDSLYTTISKNSITFSGTYTISNSSTADFSSISQAITALESNGICGSVNFLISSGTYNEQLSINEINGASSTNTITFQSASGNNTDVIISYGATDAYANYVIALDGADYITFKNLSIVNNNTSIYGKVISLNSTSCNNNIFDHNIITGIDVNSYEPQANLVWNYTALLSSNNSFINNTFKNGNCAIYLFGSSTLGLMTGTIISNNEFSNQYYGAVYLNYTTSPTVTNNNISSSKSTSFTGVRINDSSEKINVSNNKISASIGLIGIILSNCTSTSGNESLISNNMIYFGGSTGSIGIYLTATTYCNVYYNSINIASTSSTAKALYLPNISSSATIKVINNILYNSGSGYAYYASGSSASSGISTSNYNDLYTAGSNIGYWNNANVTTFSKWKTKSGKDANSINVVPGFTYSNSSDLHLASTSTLINKGTYLSNVLTDFDSQARSTTIPCIGADEYSASGKTDNFAELDMFDDNFGDLEGDILKLYPNPTAGTLNVNITDAAIQINSVEIVDIVGNIVSKTNVNTNSLAIDLSKFNSGVYFVRVYSSDKKCNIHKIVLEFSSN